MRLKEGFAEGVGHAEVCLDLQEAAAVAGAEGYVEQVGLEEAIAYFPQVAIRLFA